MLHQEKTGNLHLTLQPTVVRTTIELHPMVIVDVIVIQIKTGIQTHVQVPTVVALRTGCLHPLHHLRVQNTISWTEFIQFDILLIFINIFFVGWHTRVWVLQSSYIHMFLLVRYRGESVTSRLPFGILKEDWGVHRNRSSILASRVDLAPHYDIRLKRVSLKSTNIFLFLHIHIHILRFCFPSLLFAPIFGH